MAIDQVDLPMATQPAIVAAASTSGVPALSGSGRSLLLRWLIAIIAFPIGVSQAFAGIVLWKRLAREEAPLVAAV